MKTTVLLLTAALGFATTLAAQVPPAVERTYQVDQSVTLSDVPASAKQVKWWIAIPDNAAAQELLNLQVVSAPGHWQIVREPDHGNRFLYVEVQNPGATSLTAQISFAVRRQSSYVSLDPAKAGPVTESLQRLLAEDLQPDAPHMAVTPRIAAMAKEICGEETNVVKQVRLLENAVADNYTHYSIDPTKPKCSIGDANACMAAGGGCCTDIHSLFIALARARGIPARLNMGYRVLAANNGKEVDPGYRCWPEYFVPNYGWVPADLIEAENPKGLGRDRWFSGLTEQRIHLNEGREFDLAGRANAARVNTMAIGYAEIDGVPARVLPEGDKPAQLSRRVRATEANANVAVAQSSQRIVASKL